jgi:hypothetical protein
MMWKPCESPVPVTITSSDRDQFWPRALSGCRNAAAGAGSCDGLACAVGPGSNTPPARPRPGSVQVVVDEEGYFIQP